MADVQREILDTLKRQSQQIIQSKSPRMKNLTQSKFQAEERDRDIFSAKEEPLSRHRPSRNMLEDSSNYNIHKTNTSNKEDQFPDQNYSVFNIYQNDAKKSYADLEENLRAFITESPRKQSLVHRDSISRGVRPLVGKQPFVQNHFEESQSISADQHEQTFRFKSLYEDINDSRKELLEPRRASQMVQFAKDEQVINENVGESNGLMEALARDIKRSRRLIN